MCGICGIAGKYDKQKPVIENMMKSIYHRGPGRRRKLYK